MISNFCRFGDRKTAYPVTNFTLCDSLTTIIEALESFRRFKPSTKRSAITFHAADLAKRYGWQLETAELHLYRIACHAGLEVL